MATTRQDIEFNATFNFNRQDAAKLDLLLGDAFTESLQRAAKLGAHKMGDELHKKLAGSISSTAGAVISELEVLHADIERLHGELENAATDADRRTAQNNLKKKQIEVQQKERLINKERAVFDAFLDRQEEALQEYDKLSLRVSVDKKGLAKDFSDAMNDAVSKLNTGEITDIFSSAFSALGQGGKVLQGKGAALTAEGSAGMGRAVATLGTAAAGLAAAAGAIAGVAAIFGMAYNQAKDLNKALLEGAGSADLFATGVGALAPKLEELRGATIEVAMKTRLATDEVAKYMNTLNSTGITYKMMEKLAGDNVSAQQAYVDVTMEAIKASKNLGIEVNEAGSFMNNMIKNLGKNSLPQISSAFEMIGDAAAQSGMATKDFFTTINESASGLALYNFRLEDTVGLMNDMVEILGEDLAKASLALQKRFGEMGMQERIKTVMTSGGAAGRILKADVGAQGKDISKSITSGIAPLMGSLAKAGENGAFELDTKALGDMSEKQLRGVLSSLRGSSEKGADVMARQIENLRDAAKGAQGGTLAQAEGIGQLSKAGELALNLTQAQGVLGKPLSEMEGLSRAAFENITGISGEQYEVLKRLDRGLRAEFEAKGGEKGMGMKFEEALASGKLQDSDAMQKAMEAGMSKSELMTSQILSETTSIGQTIKNAVAWFLEKIYNLLESFFNLYDFGGDKAKQDQAKSLSQYIQAQTKAVEDLSKVEAEMGQIGARSKSGMGTEEDKRRMEVLKAAQKKAQAEVEGYKKGYEAIGAGKGSREALRVSGETIAEKGGGTTLLSLSRGQDVQEQARKDVEAKRASSPFTGLFDMISSLSPGGNPLKDLQIRQRETQIKGERGYVGGGAGNVKFSEMGFKSPEGLTVANAADQKQEKKEEKQDVQVNKDAKAQKKATETSADDIIKNQQQLADKAKSEKQAEARTQLGYAFGDAAVGQAAAGRAKIVITPEMMARFPGLAGAAAASGLGAGVTAKAEDFIYRGNGTSGTITPINSMDRAIAMAKPGGPLERVAGGGGGGNVTIIIQGGDLNKVREVVMNTVKLGMNARGV